MFPQSLTTPVLAGAALLGLGLALVPGSAAAQGGVDGEVQTRKIERLEREIRVLRRQNTEIATSLAAANTSEAESAKALSQIKSRLEALDRSIFGGSDERLIEAVTSVESLTKRQTELETAALALSSDIQDYLRTAIAADPDARATVEESLRVLDSVLGLRQKPRPNVATGSLSDARVVSIDAESGLLVLNVGTVVGVTSGMTFTLRRGDQTLGEAIIVDVRDSVSGAFVETLNDPQNTVRLDDSASLIIDRR